MLFPSWPWSSRHVRDSLYLLTPWLYQYSKIEYNLKSSVGEIGVLCEHDDEYVETSEQLEIIQLKYKLVKKMVSKVMMVENCGGVM